MKVYIISFLILASAFIYCHEHPTKEEIQNELNQKAIYYGSTLRIRNQNSRHHLYSMDVSYGSGSRGQVVTATESDSEIGSYFTIKHGHGKPIQTFTNTVKCGDIIRLEHINTGKNIYGSNHASPVSNKLEISAQGQNGESDGNDNFVIECIGQSKGSDLVGKTEFYLQHLNTSQFLTTSRRFSFNQNNCGFNCPIMNHLEVSCQRSKDNETKWKIVGGIILQKSQFSNDNDKDPLNDYDDDDDDDEEHYNPSSNTKKDANVEEDEYEEVNFNRRDDL
ncbi:DEAD/DEAH-box helicase family protein (macronuclear) [Tetrahymena thermophila SB210]|uniref:DEAD/DEAH-box helicase family protein n=1 Tax=Tetrahymena thermophila (strain SB210) TaxID=312017 RepID=W7X841_TETTS|nr:DEAD/DEAH-box helicase family protein [Tetrahymena thermophila SB210]EWS73512.1 DEAD/DEAH-box helicase family protein [Tetrahymena thermophila SB210]|eukprot:XP_012653994.1 DEAD/DEAH-box helicase family protein [Tetrahymena thermophila SB210]